MDVVLNWLWQGGVVGLAAVAILHLVPRSHAGARYGVARAALAAVVVLPAVPMLASVFVSPAGGAPALASPPVAMPATWWTSSTAALAACTLWTVMSVWRTSMAILTLRRIRHEAIDFPPDAAARLRHWHRLRTTGRRARLVLSPSVRTAGVVGGRTPVIAVAPVLLERLTADDLDRVVIHEWAHVQRRDDISRIAGRMIHALAGWHPAVWWLDRQLHIEREAACDEVAVRVTGSAKAYATCLTALAAMPATRLRVAAPAIASASGLGERVRRIVSPRFTNATRTSRLIPEAAGTAIVAALTGFVGQLEIVGALPAVATARGIAVDRALPAAPPANWREGEEPRARTGRAPTRIRAAAPVQSSQSEPKASERRVETPAVLPSAALPLTGVPSDLPGQVVSQAASGATPSATPPATTNKSPFWNGAAEAGRAVAAGSEQAAAATAGVFTRFASRVARSF